MNLPNVKDDEKVLKTPREREGDYLQRNNSRLLNCGKRNQKNMLSKFYIEYYTQLNYYLVTGMK